VEKLGTEAFISTGRRKRGRAISACRKKIAETVFGQICTTRNLLTLWRAAAGDIAYATG